MTLPPPQPHSPTNRSTFELARAYGEVIGIDLSQTFIDMANKMKAEGQVRWMSIVCSTQAAAAEQALFGTRDQAQTDRQAAE